MNNLFTHIVPWASDRDLAGFYNFHILNAPTEWVLFTDRDVLMPSPEYGLHVDAVIKRHGDKFSLITCTTNRVGTDYQVNRRMWNVEDMSKHVEAAKMAWRAHSDNLIDITNDSPISGMFMLVNKRLLSARNIKGEGLLGIDNQMHYIAQETGQRVGLAKGIYCYHYYRGGDRNDTKHLK